MILRIFTLFLLVSALPASAALEWSGTSLKVLKEDVAASTGLEAVYVAPSLQDLSVGYVGDGAGSAVWSRFSSLGGGYAEPVATGPSISDLQPDMGYIVEVAGQQYAFWLVDYSLHELTLQSLSLSAEQDCGRVALDVVGSGDEIAYYSVNGRRLTLSRDIELGYNTLVYDNENHTYTETATTEKLDYIRPVVSAPAPLCATEFSISGDKFLREWGREVLATSERCEPHSVEARTMAEQESREAENEVNNPSGTFGGSAPCVVNFEAAVTDAAIFREWQFSRTPDFEDISLRMSELAFSYTFEEQGNTYVRFYCANSDASCDYYGETYDISIGESFIKCPNAFSPFNEDGVNDEWRVSYSSIVSFECTIFNRSGRKVASFSDPSAGWDGKYNGKFVPSGVYYYVIKARGSEGREYNLSGDINIVDYK